MASHITESNNLKYFLLNNENSTDKYFVGEAPYRYSVRHKRIQIMNCTVCTVLSCIVQYNTYSIILHLLLVNNLLTLAKQ